VVPVTDADAQDDFVMLLCSGVEEHPRSQSVGGLVGWHTGKMSRVTLSYFHQCVLGTAPVSVVYVVNHLYYVNFIDDYSRFTWIYLLKSCDVYQFFLMSCNLLNVNFIAKSVQCKPIRMMNMKKSTFFFSKKLTSCKMCHVHMLTNKMVRLSKSIVIL
jgi:hypothetical protein